MITVNNTIPGFIKDIEIKGNTIQDPNTLEITSSGIPQGDGTYKMSISSANKNLFDIKEFVEKCGGHVNGEEYDSNGSVTDSVYYFDFPKGYTLSYNVTQPPTVGSPSSAIFGFVRSDNSVQLLALGVNSQKFTSSEDYIGIKLINYCQGWKISNVQLEEGTQTPYVQHESNKSDIVLPCGLDGFGGVKDKVYFDKDRGKWCVEKKTIKVTNLYETKFTYDSNLRRFYGRIDGITNKALQIGYSNKFTYDNDAKGDMSLLVHGGMVYLYNYSIDNLEDFMNWLKQEEVYLICERDIPQIIELPQSAQILLNSFMGTTHLWVESGESQATIKATVPKSIHASVQSNVKAINDLNTKVIDIEGLKESQDFEYETEGSLVCKNTKVGSVKDLKIYGKTLVNLFGSSGAGVVKANANGWSTAHHNCELFDVGEEYTFVMWVIKNSDTAHKYCVRVNYTTESGGGFIQAFSADDINKGFAISTLKIEKNIDKVESATRFATTDLEIRTVAIKGRLNENEIKNYFEGLLSLVDIEASTRKENGNILNLDKFSNVTPVKFNGVDCYQFKDSGKGFEYHDTFEKNTQYSLTFKFYREVNTTYSIDVFVIYTDETKQRLNIRPNIEEYFTTHPNKTIKYLKCGWSYSHNGYIDLTITNLVNGTIARSFEDYVGSKKPLLYHDTTTDTWKPIPMLCGKWENGKQVFGDVVDGENGKWYKRTNQVVLDGVSEFTMHSIETSSTHVKYMIRKSDIKYNSKLICDKLKFYDLDKPGVWNYEGISSVNTSYSFIINLDISKVATPDKNGLIEYLKANPITIIYELAQEEVYDIAPLSLDTYEGETMVSCSSGSIQASMNFKITSNVNNLILHNKKRINDLEKEAFKSTVFQNKVLLDSTYNSDKITFEVNTLSNKTSTPKKIELDYDLFDLMKGVISVGKDNYDRVEIEQKMDFYQLIGKFDWGMWDSLFEIIEQQHNPPVIPEDPPVEPVLIKLNTNRSDNL